MTVATGRYELPVGHTDTGTPARVHLRAAGLGHPVVLTGGPGTGKTVLLAHLATHARAAGLDVVIGAPVFETKLDAVPGTRFTEPGQLLAHLHQPAPPRVVLIDNAAAAFAEAPETWSRVLTHAPAARWSMIATTNTLHPAAFGHHRVLRAQLLGGSLLRLPTTSTWDRRHEHTVDLGALTRHQTAYLQNPADDTPQLVHLQVW